MIRACLICLCLFVLQVTAAPVVFKNNYRSPRNPERAVRKSTRLIILHTTEAHAKSSLNKLSERGEAHYCVVEDGTVYRIVDRNREAFHAGRSMWNGREDCDTYSIGIEVVGHHDQSMPLAQLAALKELIAQLQGVYGLSDDKVICHSHVAYGAPNKWHRHRHRGRKRCGMLFAMPSVRRKLGLDARPARDADIAAKRLVQGDAYLHSVLYGKVDTMARVYGRGAPSSGTPARREKPPAAFVRTPAAPKRQDGPPAKAAANTPPPPPPSSGSPSPAPPSEAEKEEGLIARFVPNFFQKKAKLVIPDASPRTEASPRLELPKDLQIGRAGDTVRDLKTLESLPGYVKGGPVTAELSPYRIAGSAWKAPDTYYYLRGKITPGNKIDERAIEVGTLIFFRDRKAK